MSKGIAKICRILEENNIKYLTEQSIKGCISPKNKLLSFDIFIPKINTYIEYDGKQHFSKIEYWDKNDREFMDRQIRDKIKDDFCLNNNIKLIRISYLENIENKLNVLF